MAVVVITGSSRGLGRALAIEFLNQGDQVVLSSRNVSRIEELTSSLYESYGDRVFGVPCDINDWEQLKEMAKVTEQHFGKIDFWVNNAGIKDSERNTLRDADPDMLASVIHTNLTSQLIATKIAMKHLARNGKIFFVEGLGTTGRASPYNVAYGVSKAGYKQLLKTLVAETKDEPVHVHGINPGMMLTDLLLDNAEQHKGVFNILAEQPSTVAQWLVPRMKKVQGDGKRIQYLTSLKAAYRFLTAWRYKNRFFDENGNPQVEIEY